jgi:hypothetical protein
MEACRNGLYPGLLCPEWTPLAEPIQRAHCNGTPVRAHGTFSIRHGPGRLARIVAIVLRLPDEANAVSTELTIIPEDDGERWERSFKGRRLTTRQYATRDGLLAERFGLLELRFALEVDDGALVYLQGRASIRLGPVRLNLPRWLAPRVSGREEAAGQQSRVQIEVDLPFAGRLILYEGLLCVEDERA